MQAFQQPCGFNTLMYYSASLFQEIGFNQPMAIGLIISGTDFVFTLVALKLVFWGLNPEVTMLMVHL